MWRLGFAALALAGCSQIFGLDVPTVSSATPDDAPPGTVTIGGQVNGLIGAGLVLQNNGGDDKPIGSSGNFVFPTAVPLGTSYDVTVSVQPSNPSQMCTVMNGSGTADANIGGVVVTCVAATYTIGGTVQGLTGSVMLHNNGADDITISANGAFMFPTAVESGQMYSVTATGNSACTVFGGAGTVGNGNVTSVLVNCSSASGPFAIGGMVSGLNGSVTLHNSTNNDTVTLNAMGTYAFPMLVPSAGTYNVSVQTQPLYPPAKQNCTVANGSGTANGNVQNINVTCTTQSFTVGGNVNGLQGTVVFQNNGAGNLSVSASGPFTFATPVLSGSSYNVTVLTQPATQTCSLAMATGTVQNSNVTNVAANCVLNDMGVTCGANMCSGNEGCCDPNGGAVACKLHSQCSSLWMPCDDAHDCSGGEICCADPNASQTKVNVVSCSATCGGENKILCDPAVTMPCPAGLTCKAYALLPDYYACQL